MRDTLDEFLGDLDLNLDEGYEIASDHPWWCAWGCMGVSCHGATNSLNWCNGAACYGGNSNLVVPDCAYGTSNWDHT